MSNKGYATTVGIVGGNPGSGLPAAYIKFDLIVLAPDGSQVPSTGINNPLYAGFNYGDSNEDIRQSIVAVSRDTVGDSSLSVNIIPG